jgi:DNA-binding transcriptional LysR family regulator
MAESSDWDLYRSFLAVARAGSLSGAARDLGASQPTVGRHITALEQRLGISLFTRSPGGLIATEAALALRPHAEAMAAAALALGRASASSANETAGVVRLAASEIIGGAVLPPVVGALRAGHPQLTVELALSNRNEDLLRRGADLAVRMNRPTQAALFGRKVGVVDLHLYATPDYLARHGTPANLDERAGHTVIGFDQVPVVIAGAPIDRRFSRELFDLRCDNDLACLNLVAAGVGIGACQDPLARRLGPVRVLEDAFHVPLPVWVVMHEDLKTTPRMRVVFDALVAGLGAYLRE